MELTFININKLRQKALEKINKYLSLSEHNRLTIGFCQNGKCYVFGTEEENNLFYDIGSVTKTVTAHLILKLCDDGFLDINEKIDKYLPLKKGKYPSIYQLQL